MFKDLFVQLLQERNVTAYKLSKETGLSETLISNWKSGRQLPKFDSIIILCDYFNVSADYLLGRAQDTNISNNHDNLNSVIGQVNAPVTIHDESTDLSAQERDLLQIFRSADGRKQIEIMQYMYGVENG